MRAALHHQADQYRPRRPAYSRLSEDLSKRADAGDRRSRSDGGRHPDFDLRIGSHHDLPLPRRQDGFANRTHARNTMSPSGSAGSWPIKAPNSASKAISGGPWRPGTMAIFPMPSAASTMRRTASMGS